MQRFFAISNSNELTDVEISLLYCLTKDDKLAHFKRVIAFDEAINQALNNGFQPLSLGKIILKTKTAAIAAFAMLKYWIYHVNI